MKFYNEVIKLNVKINLKKKIKKSNTNSIFKDKNIVFSGFRNKDVENFINENGGNIISKVSKNTDLLIVKDLNSTSSNVVNAKKYNIEILSLDQFLKKYDKKNNITIAK
mgnify:CR=1 FL=1